MNPPRTLLPYIADVQHCSPCESDKRIAERPRQRYECDLSAWDERDIRTVIVVAGGVTTKTPLDELCDA